MTRVPRERWIVAAVLVIVVSAFTLMCARYFPSANGCIGHDYAYFYPHLLAGSYAFTANGPFSIPWFTPAFGGGLPFYAHPASGYVSVPQLIAFFTNATSAVLATLAIFDALGFLGMYALLRRGMELSLPAALFGATAFAWNGFFTSRMLIGHLGFHSFMLTPFVALWLVRATSEPVRVRALVIDALLAGLAFAYMFQSGNFYGIVPAVIAAAAIALVQALRGARIVDFAWRLAGSALAAVLLSAAKLSASLAFLASCPRAGYPLPGASSVFGALKLVILTVFFSAPLETAHEILTNTKYELGPHELDFGVTWLPLVLLAGAIVGLHKLTIARADLPRRIALAASLLFVLAIPIAVNVYSPGWHEILKRVPIVANSSNLVRWFAAYVPIAIALAAFAFDRWPIDRTRRALAGAVLMALAVLLQANKDRSFFANQIYDPRPIDAAFAQLHASGVAPPITRSDVLRDTHGKIVASVDRDNCLAQGVSQILCYEPMFGYELEWFPIGTLHPGGALELSNGVYDFKNPASYVFPRENGLEPGDHFRADQENELRALLAYRPFAYEKSTQQEIADVVNLLALIGVTVLSAFIFLKRK